MRTVNTNFNQEPMFTKSIQELEELLKSHKADTSSVSEELERRKLHLLVSQQRLKVKDQLVMRDLVSPRVSLPPRLTEDFKVSNSYPSLIR